MTRRILTLLAPSVVAAVTLAGCSPAPDPSATRASGAGTSPASEAALHALGHVHGLGVDPGDGTLYVASHTGVYSVSGSGTISRVADRYQDTMGFSVLGPGHFLASGHPDLREDLPGQLGLIESTDAAETWTALSKQGVADFHVLEPAGDRLYAYDSVSGALVSSSDRRDWTVLEKRPLFDLAVSPTDPGVLFATTSEGEVLRRADGSKLTAVPGAPRLGPLDSQADGPLVGLGADGTVHVSTDDGATWSAKGRVPGEVEALDVTAKSWHAATSEGVFKSWDAGVTWTPVVMVEAKH